MSLYDGLAENSRRNERVDRGSLTFTGTSTIVLGPTPNASAGAVLNSTHGNMRKMTHFELTIDDGGSALVATAAIVSGFINTSNQTVGSIVYPAGTVLNVRSTAVGAAGGVAAGTTAQTVRWVIWGNLSGAAGF